MLETLTENEEEKMKSYYCNILDLSQFQKCYKECMTITNSLEEIYKKYGFGDIQKLFKSNPKLCSLILDRFFSLTKPIAMKYVQYCKFKENNSRYCFDTDKSAFV